MATLHRQFTQFNDKIRLTDNRKNQLIRSRDALRDKIDEYFYHYKSNELQPKFRSQGSFETDTAINPIPKYDREGNSILKYDLDDGVYFIEIDGENNRKHISTWHDWVFNAIQYHTNITPKRKNTCVRVIFAKGHHIDLPIYYEKNGYYPELAHRSQGWIVSDPQEFIDWFESQSNIKQLKRIVRYLKAWKNYRESNNTNLKFPSGFALTILAANNFVPKPGKDDVAFMETVRKIRSKLKRSFSCKSPALIDYL